MIAQQKRNKLEQQLPSNALVILHGKSETVRNGDVYYPFRQDSDFQLLTGLNIPGLILVGKSGNQSTEWIIYADPISEKEQLWGTNRLDASELSIVSGIKDIRNLSRARSEILEMITSSDILYLRESESANVDEKNFFLDIDVWTKHHSKIYQLTDILKELRMYKIEGELEMIRKAVSITHEAYHVLKKILHPGIYEYEIEAAIAGVFRSYQSIESYPSIVASGPNSCIMHYMRHNRKLEENDLVLIDFGAEYACYSSDVTRTFFVSTPTKRQQEVYESTKRVKDFAQSLLPSIKSRSMHEDKVREFLVEELKSLSLIPKGMGLEEAKIASREYLPYRSLNHHLGLDTHDIGSKDDLIAPGMVLTCEPGIYIKREGIGIRLEDDLAITDDGYRNLSEEIPL